MEAREVEELAATLRRTALENEGLRSLLDRLPLSVLVRNREGRVLYVNGVGASGYGVTPAEMVGRLWADVLPAGNDVLGSLQVGAEAIEQGAQRTIEDFPFRTSHGNVLKLLLYYTPLVFDGEPAVMINAFDNTASRDLLEQRSELERRLAGSQRLEGLGLMAGGIAHDFNNLLVGVFANAELLQHELDPGSRAAGYLANVQAAGRQLADLTRYMLTYAGRDHVEREPTELSRVVGDTLGLLHAALPAHVDLATCIPEGLPGIQANATQLGQVLLNLVTNAAEALGERAGAVQVRASVRPFDPVATACLALRPVRTATEYVCLEVVDDGPGMDAATRDRIFDPFFTSKGTGRGLGLAAVLGIARAHQAGVQVDSAPGEGTRICIWLPPASGIATPLPPAVRTSVPPPGRVVLVVDDQSVARQATAALLEHHGFVVHLASSGEEAAARARTLSVLDAVVLDMSMPGMPLHEVHASLRAQRPGLPILLNSGFGEPALLEELLRMPGTAFIQKPFTERALLGQLDELMAAASGPDG